ncbi:MAG: hypothetical protein HN764_00200 [Gammaproteobacteria bacterium]|nr:hypothetical protein [Gammaproteobacteria bacterium]
MSKKTKKHLDSSEKTILSPKNKKISSATVEFKGDKRKITVLQEEKYVFGDTKAFMKMILIQLISSITHSDETKGNGAIAMYAEINPQDGIERLLAAQMVAVHNMSMECSRRAMLPDQTIEGVECNINRVTKLNRTFIAQTEVLNKYRSGGKQTIQVQHVNVNEGGRAIVGDVKGGGGNG